MIKNNTGVKLKGLNSQIVLGYTIANNVLTKHGYYCMITSVNDGKHMDNSKHYSGDAIDIRCKHIPKCFHNHITDELKQALGENFDVVYEGNHWHIEYENR